MGKLMNKDVNMFKDIIKQGKDRSELTEYSKHLESKPIFVIYYSQDSIVSTADIGLQAVQKIVGKDSPIVYNRIKEFPLYNVPTTQIELSEDEYGLKPGFSGDAVMLPGLITPKPGDFFSIPYLGQYLFKITDIDADTIKSNSYYKVSFKFSKDSHDHIQTNVGGDYTVIYDNIGTNETRTILRDEELMKVEQIKELQEDIFNLYYEYFFDKDLNCFITEDMNVSIYDPYLTKFIMDNSLGKTSKYNLILTNESKGDRLFNRNYDTSLYRVIETCDLSSMTILNNKALIQPIAFKYGSVFDIYNRFGVMEVILKKDNLQFSPDQLDEECQKMFKKLNTLYSTDYFPEDLKLGIMSNQLLQGEDFPTLLKNMIILHCNNVDIANKYLKSLQENYSYYITNRIDYFLYTPIILYVLNNIVNNIMKKI